MNQATANVNFRMDKNLKQQLESLCAELGLNMSTAFNIFAKAMVRQQRIPFEVGIERPNEETLKAMANIEKQENLSRRFSSTEELMEDLYA